MARPAERSDGMATRAVVGVVALVIVWLVLRSVLGFVFSLIRVALFVALFAVIAWVVLVGPPDSRT